jgi:hypothetical protein
MATDSLTIDCGTCLLEGTSACDDCVVTFICGSEGAARATVVVLRPDEARAVRLLGEAGLVPPVRHVDRAG